MPEEIRAIQCRSCGGAMYSDQKAAAYVCAFCGTSAPWRDAPEFWASPITFRHKPVQIIDGAMKLGHVEVMTGVDPHDARVLSQRTALQISWLSGTIQRRMRLRVSAGSRSSAPSVAASSRGIRRSISLRATTATIRSRTSSSYAPAHIGVSSSWASARRMCRRRRFRSSSR